MTTINTIGIYTNQRKTIRIEQDHKELIDHKEYLEVI